MIFKELDGGLSVIDNIKVAGAKEGKYGVAVIVCENSDASAVFTSNKIVAAPVIYTKKSLKKERFQQYLSTVEMLIVLQAIRE